MPLAPGETIAGYTVVRQIGSGGMGAVYLVRHPRLPRMDALKLLKPEFSSDPDFSRRFLREADVVAGLSHRNIVAVLDRGEDRGQLWLTMQYIEGIDAEQALADGGGIMPPDRVAHIVTEVAAALDAAHRHHLIHRDVKPANILLSPSGDDDEREQVFLTDFGIAKSLQSGNTRLTRTGAVLATFDYASPEQIESRSPDARSDIYSLACVLYKLLTGSVPYPGPGVAAAIHGHLQLPPPKPTTLVPWLAPRIDDVVARAMNKDPAERYQTCRAFAAAAAAALGDFPAPPPPPYTVQLTGPTGALLGPMTTERLSSQETDQLVDLVRRTRFFDLPENLHEVAGRTTTGHRPRGGRPITLEIRAGRSVRRVVADLDEARRPATLDALVAAVEKLPPPPDQAPAPATRLNDLRSAQAAIAARAARAVPPPTAPASGAAPSTGAGPWTAGTSGQGSTAARPEPARGQSLPQQPVWQPQAPAQQPPYGVPSGGFGPGGPATPWTPSPVDPGGGGRRKRALLVVVLVLVLAAAAVGVWLATRGDDDPGGGGTGSSSSATDDGTSPAQEALDALPRSPEPLGGEVLILPRVVDDDTDLHLVDAATGETITRLTSGTGDDVGPVVSPDRRSVAYVRVADDVAELRVIAADGSADSPLFSSPPAECERPGRPAWNPQDQTQVALICAGAGTEPDALRLYTLDGALVRTLETGHTVLGDLAISADGTAVGYWAGDDPEVDGGDLYRLAADGTQAPVQITDVAGGADADMVWSNDGTRIAFRREVAPGERQIFVMNADGTDPRSLTSGNFDQDPIFSPDDTQIAYKSNRTGPVGADDHVWIMGSDGSDPRQLVAPDGPDRHPPAWGRR